MFNLHAAMLALPILVDYSNAALRYKRESVIQFVTYALILYSHLSFDIFYFDHIMNFIRVIMLNTII